MFRVLKTLNFVYYFFIKYTIHIFKRLIYCGLKINKKERF